MNITNQLRQSQRNKPQHTHSLTDTSKSFDHLIRNISKPHQTHIEDTHSHVQTQNSDVYNIPWDLKQKQMREQQAQLGEGDQYCAPWDLRLQEEKLKAQLNPQATPPPPPPPPQLTQDEYNQPWESQRTLETLIKKQTLNTSTNSSSTSSTCSPTHHGANSPQLSCLCEVPNVSSHLLQPICINHLNLNKIQQLQQQQQQIDANKFSSLGSNSSCSSQATFDDTRPLLSNSRSSKSSPPSSSQLALQPPPPPLPSQPAYMVALEKQLWFHGKITRKRAEDLLMDKRQGSFLVRQSESGNQNDFSLSLVSASGCVHMRICLKTGEFILGQCSQPFPTIIKMIEHYNKVEVPIKGAQHVKLTNPISK